MSPIETTLPYPHQLALASVLLFGLVYVAPNSVILIPTNSIRQRETTNLQVDSLRMIPLGTPHSEFCLQQTTLSLVPVLSIIRYVFMGKNEM